MLVWRWMDNLRMAHLRSDTIERYSFGTLADLSLKRTEQHLILCESCRERLDEFETFLTSLRGAQEPMTLTAGTLAFTQ